MGRRLLRRLHEGALACGDRRAEVRFVVDGGTGGVVMPVEVGFARAGELVLIAPDEPGCVWEASLTPRVIERPEAEEAVDRWAAYHGHHAMAGHHGGAPGGQHWVRCVVTGLKSAEGVFGEEETLAVNPLRGKVESRLVKAVNGDRAALARACKVHGPIEVAEPLVVGIDPLGMDVRARFGIVRLEFPENIYAGTDAQAERAVAFLMGTRAWGEGST